MEAFYAVVFVNTHTQSVFFFFFWRIHISLLADNGQCWWLRRSLTPRGGFDVIPRADNLSLLLLHSWNANFSLYLMSLFGQPNADYSVSSILASWQSLTFKHSDRFSHCSLSKMLKIFSKSKLIQCNSLLFYLYSAISQQQLPQGAR